MKLLISEDEPLCLKNLEELDWKSIGIDAVFTAKDGEQAYQIALEQRPEIILSDIQMPKITGLELAKKLSVILPEIRFIILTAHRNFSYAQEAITSSVFAYIVKPFLDDDILSAVTNAISDIHKEESKNSYKTQLAKRIEADKHFLLDYFFNIVSEEFASAHELLKPFGVNDPSRTCTAMVISLDYSQKLDSVNVNYRIFNNLIRIFSELNIDFIPFINTTQLVYFFLTDTALQTQDTINKVLECSTATENYLNFNYTEKYVIGIGNPCAGISYCKNSYISALDAVKYSFYLGFNSTICIFDLESSSDDLADYKFFPKEKFFGYVKAGDFENAKSLLKKLFSDFRRNQASNKTIQHICHELLVQLSRCIQECGQNADIVFNKSNPWDILRQKESVDDIETFLTDFVDVVISTITFRYNQKVRDLVNEIKDYIHNHPDTYLNEIAKHFFHSPNYLSNVFSKEAGITIKNYIILARIERSKELLRNSQKSISAIAAAVGYKTAHHFSATFTKQVGMPPALYRISAQNENK